jgi:hypothetical protein
MSVGVTPSNVYNANRTNVNFSMESTYTLAEQGSRTVLIKGAESSIRLTTMLGTSINGGKVNPFLIFKASVKANGRMAKIFD